MIDAPLALAFAAGLVATVNPCGFAMLPAYLSYFVGLEDGSERQDRPAAVARALTIGGVVSAGFLVVFGVAGVLITFGFRQVITVVPWLALLVGAAVAVLGVAMLRGYEPTVRLPGWRHSAEGKGYGSALAFGVSYAAASLSCTLPVFLTVVAGATTQGSFAAAVATFISYGLGMSLLLIAVTLGLALGKRSLIARLRRSARYVGRLAGGMLLLAGVYVVWFWATNLARGVGAQTASGPVALVEALSSRATTLIGEHPVVWGVVLGSVVAGTIAYAVAGSLRRGTGSQARPRGLGSGEQQ